MKLLKKSALLIAGLFLLMTLVLWVFTHVISPDSLKIALNKHLSDLTSQPTKIEGDIAWQLFPKPGIRITKINIGQGQDAKYAAVLDNLFLNLQFTSLIRGKLVFNELKVDGFKLHVNTTKQAPKRDVPLSSVAKATDKVPAKFAIEQVLFTRGNISFITEQRGLTLNNVQVGASHVNFQNGFFPVQMKGSLLSTGPKVNLNAYVTFKGRTRLTQQLFSQGLASSDNSLVEGQISIQDLQFNRFKITKINATSILKSGQLTLNPLNLTFYRGKSVGDLTFQTSTKKISFNQIASGVNSTSFLKALLGSTPIKGPMDFSIHGSTVLSSDWQDNLVGKGNITVKDGVLNFVNLNAVLNNFSSKLKLFLASSKSISDLKLGEQLESSTPMKGKTPFQLISVEYQLDKNLQLHESALLQANVLQMKGEGVVSLKDYVIQHRAIVKVTSGDKTLDNLQNLLNGSIPLHISGTLFEPVILPDVQKIAPIAAQLLLKKSLEKPMQQFETQLNNLLDKANLTTL